MRLFSEDTAAVSVGAEQSGSFGIANNAKAFRVLSDSIYQDKPGSMIRETACNGLDSHIQNGNPETPIQIHLPDQFEPFYSVRDFGLGMSPETVRNVFCVYFESTKAQSNDVVGAFGLGAKTPFAYTDKFTVTSIYNGVKYMYAAYYADSGEPTMDLMFEEETDEANGVEINVPVAQSDFRTFRESLKSQLRFFPVKPVILNGNGFTFDDDPEFSLNTDSVSVLKSVDTYSDLNRSFIVQGPVGYAIDNSLLISKVDDAMAEGWAGAFDMADYKFLRAMIDTATWFKFDIGEIGVTASREGVEYTKFTVGNIMKKIKVIHKEMIAHVDLTLKEATNSYERVAMLNRMENFSDLIKHINVDVGTANKERYGRTYTFSLEKQKVFRNVILDANGKVVADSSDFQITSYSRNYSGGLKSNRSADIELIPGSNEDSIRIIFRDTTTRPILRLRQYFEDNKNVESVYVIAANGSMDSFEKRKLEERIIAAFGGYDPKIVKLQDCAEPPSNGAVRNRASYSRPTAYRLPANGGFDTVSRWDREYEDIDDAEFGMDKDGNTPLTAAYVVVERQRITTNAEWGLYVSLKQSEMIDVPVFAIRSADVDKLADSSINWVSLVDYMNAKRTEIRKSKSIRRYAYAKRVNELAVGSINASIYSLEGVESEDLDAMRKFVNDSKSILDSDTVTDQILNIAGHSLPRKFERAVLTPAQSFKKKTSLLANVHTSRYATIDSNKDHVVNYINWAVKQ